MKNALLGGLVVLVIGLGAWIYLNRSIVTPAGVINPTPLAQNQPDSVPTSTPESQTGTITGKLCYPSQFLPQGKIEAKEVVTQQSTFQPYPGSQQGGQSTYSLNVSPGTYILRYAAGVDANTTSYGYHSQTCLTGLETTCAQSYPRVHAQVNVGAGETVSSVDLCDFYYDPQNPPAF